MEEIGRTSFQSRATWDHRLNTQKVQFPVPGDVTVAGLSSLDREAPRKRANKREEGLNTARSVWVQTLRFCLLLGSMNFLFSALLVGAEVMVYWVPCNIWRESVEAERARSWWWQVPTEKQLGVGLRLGRSKGQTRDKQTSESSKAAGQEQEELGFGKKGLHSRS